jgi:hypothetical protein
VRLEPLLDALTALRDTLAKEWPDGLDRSCEFTAEPGDRLVVSLWAPWTDEGRTHRRWSWDWDAREWWAIDDHEMRLNPLAVGLEPALPDGRRPRVGATSGGGCGPGATPDHPTAAD